MKQREKIAADNVLSFEQKHIECNLSNQDRRYISGPKLMTIKLYVYPHSDESHFRSPTRHLCCRFLEFEYDAPCLYQ